MVVDEMDSEELLRAGRYAEGWAAFEARQSRGKVLPEGYPYPEWKGEPLDGKTIFVVGEQGIGDEIQLVRFLPALKRLGAAQVYLYCLGPSMQLFRGVGADRIYNRLVGLKAPRQDYWVGLYSLPHRLGLTLESLSGAPYLKRPNVPATGKVGLVWRGSPGHPNDANRSLPSPDLLASIPNGVFLEPEGDMVQSAAKLASLSAVVTVDTSWAHLAGAMGVPAHVLLPAIGTDWRWGASGSRTPWYDSLRLYRQTTPGDWTTPIREVIAALEDRERP
jgi:hypothetical protein